MEPRKKILIADDERGIVENLRDLLESKGFNTVYAYEGIRAIEVAHKEKPDLIILDLNMPAGTGQTVIQNLKSRNETKEIPILVLSGMDEPHLKQKVVALGAKDFVPKPYDVEDLLGKIYDLVL
ncbi:MAG: hypothetical protein A2048_08280 [Deltaproteobacteria bacterium GWA2_45_12]|nr:MAG: hypothetical protein A2048_08280 [Deltaproteobacteria bacterium GWA2_45_12]